MIKKNNNKDKKYINDKQNVHRTKGIRISMHDRKKMHMTRKRI